MLLNNLIPQKAKQTRQEAVSFESSLASEFRSLTSKSGENVRKVNQQLDILIEQAELENEIANRVAKLAAMFSKNSLLETLSYSKIEERLSVFPKKTEEDIILEKKNTKKSKVSEPKKQPKVNPPKKLASGGVTPPASGLNKDKLQSNKGEQIAYSEVLQLSMRASGIFAITTLGEFIQGTGALGAFFKPYLKSVVTPFALSLGVEQNLINSLLNSPIESASLELKNQQKEFGKTWAKFLNDPDFVKIYIDREATLDAQGKPKGFVPADWKEDPEFVALVNAFAEEWELNANGLLALMASESGLKPDAENDGGCVGLIQFCPGGGLPGTGKSAAELKAMSRSEQWPYVVKYWVGVGLKKGMTAGDIYGLTHVPAWYGKAVNGLAVGSPERMNAVVATSADGPAYSQNARLDFNGDGKITVQDYDDEVRRVGKNFGIKYETGGYYTPEELDMVTPMTPYLLSGPDSGYDVVIQNTPIIMHGDEIVEETPEGVKIYPVKNRLYDITKDPVDVIKRWQQISLQSNTQRVESFARGGVTQRPWWDKMGWFGGAAAERKRTQKNRKRNYGDDYKRQELILAAKASGGSGLADIRGSQRLKQVFDDQRTTTNKLSPSKSESLVISKLDPSLTPMQNWAKLFPDLARKVKPGQSGYDEIQKVLSSSGTREVASQTKSTGTVIVNRIPIESSPNVSQSVQSSTPTQITTVTFNPHRLRSELNMRRAR